MMTRRDVMAGSLLGTLAPGGAAESSAEQDMTGVERALREIRSQLDQVRDVLDDGLRQPSLSFGHIVPVRRTFDQFLRANGKFPDYVEIGNGVFMDVYDWHVKYQQPIQMTRTTDNRMVIRFMLTQLILRHEQEPGFIGPPYDRNA